MHPHAQQFSQASPIFSLTIKHGGATESLQWTDADPELSQIAGEITNRTGLDPRTIKLLGAGKGALVLAQASPNTKASAVGLRSGARVMVLGSHAKDMAAVHMQAQKAASDRRPGFEHEAMLAAARRRTARPVTAPPSGIKNTFGNYEVMHTPGLYPSPDEAMKLLYRLASDAGIMAVMEKHNFSVGKLAEMPPEGLVGVDPVCVLGYNTNAGQSIYLRLRTDDMKGFRKYEAIRATLCHELTHNVWGDHDNNFKALCSQINKEVEEVHVTRQRAVRLVESTYDQDSDQQSAISHPAMAATATSSGKTLRTLAKENKPHQQKQHLKETSVVVSTSTPKTTLIGGDKGHGSILASSVNQDSGLGLGEDSATLYEHFDPQTEEQERRQRALEQ